MEIAVVLAIMGALAIVAVPSFTDAAANQRLRDAARELGGAFSYARSEAIRTGNIQLVFVTTDADGATLVDAGGKAVQAMIVDDGAPGSANQDCVLTTGEDYKTLSFIDGISLGVTGTSTRATNDLGTGAISSGSSFTEPGGTAASWVAFRPEGIPVAFDSACAVGGTGTGAGAIYLTNGNRTQAVVLAPLGNVQSHHWDVDGSAWRD